MDALRLVTAERPGEPAGAQEASRPSEAAREAVSWLVDRMGRLAGQRVAITVGSRGFAGLVPLLARLCGLLRLRGAEPILLPAMGSHGGGTWAGQLKVLDGLGVTPAAAGGRLAGPAAVVPTAIGRSPGGREVYVLRGALEADAVIIYNRVKPHPSFDGAVQSGIRKMLAVGLGGPRGALEAHRCGVAGLEGAILDLARFIAPRLVVAGALAVVENASGGLYRVDADGGDWGRLSAVDRRCLASARGQEPRLPADDLDLLLVDYLGKDISGTGLDTRVIGRRRVWEAPEPTRPVVRRLVVFRLSPGAAGNANGVGLADFTTRHLARAIDWDSTLANVTATTFTQRAALPPAYPSDRAAVAAALATLPSDRPLRVMRIRDTRHLGRLEVSEALIAEVEQAGYSVPPGPPSSLAFDAAGDLTDLGGD